jgi:hypothetical protein
MLLLNIRVVTSNKKTIQVALCFLNGEKEVLYEWVMKCLKELIEKSSISHPICILIRSRLGKGSYERARLYIVEG